ncbi:MAG: alpha/beta hydrolase family protein [bacterium]
MKIRNLSPQQMFIKTALEHKPSCRFTGRSPAAFAAWKKKVKPSVLATLGNYPERVAPEPELVAEWEQDGLLKQRWLIEVQPHLSAAFLINRPLGLGPHEKRPAILCWHGHGAFGKEPVMGNESSPELVANIKAHNYDYGQQMAHAGFITFAIDWIGCGERNDSRKPHYLSHNGGRDWCNLYYLHATMLGMTSLSINIAHGMAATDFACTLPNVDSKHLGVMGLSGGGTMTTWSLLCDKRFKAGEIICYCDQWAYFGMRDLNYCGMQVAPGLFALVDLPDLQGLIAPTPLLLDIGLYDTCFLPETTLPASRRVGEIYQAAGAADKFETDIFPGEHGWGGNKSVAFFNKYLG